MTRWSNRTNTFVVKIAYDKHGRAKATIPAILTREFDKPDTLTLELRGTEIIAKFDKVLGIKTDKEGHETQLDHTESHNPDCLSKCLVLA